MAARSLSGRAVGETSDDGIAPSILGRRPPRVPGVAWVDIWRFPSLHTLSN
jgi:hypothetical protein